ncbi:MULTISPECIES: hypothetical protein [unclassified Streptomyces]|uniref:hypothetical protein n=1 Tax=unclassified Streptomyces TaxID=2593676 RepID=UPI000DC7C62B|nr:MULTISPECIES: hypothetical protein [unclassified Streptomyces]AWZ07714.1 hypothetical protein DRB89_27360 [Streptomyces sp. ICC4]AWZ12641.1 hypothetical protein DRB96_10260 [Streptomyces sp. ICC1]
MRACRIIRELDPETLTLHRTTRDQAHEQGACARLLAAQTLRRSARAALDNHADPAPEDHR